MIAKWAIIMILLAATWMAFDAIGKPRKPITRSTARAIAVVHTIIIVTMLIWWH